MKREYGGAIFILVFVLIFEMIVIPVSAQEIKVLEQAGKDMTKSAGKPTTVVFSTKNDLKMDVSQLLSESSAFASGYGGSASAYGVNTKYLCTAPAKIELPAGIYNFFIGPSAMLGSKFRIDAQGGTQEWMLKNANAGQFVGGMLLTTGGIVAMILGFVFYGVGHSEYDYASDSYITTHNGSDLGIGIAGTLGTVVGIGLLSGSGASAKLVQIRF